MNKQELKEIIKEMIKNGELDLEEIADVALSKNALIKYLEQEKEFHMNKTYRPQGFYDSTNIKEYKARDEGYIGAYNGVIKCINRGDFNKE